MRARKNASIASCRARFFSENRKSMAALAGQIWLPSQRHERWHLLALARLEPQQLPAIVPFQDRVQPLSRLALDPGKRILEPQQATFLVGTRRVRIALAAVMK